MSSMNTRLPPASRYAFGGGTKPLSEIMFQKYDTDDDGSISSSELRSLCYDMGYYLSDDEMAWAMSVVDKDGSGQIDRREFTEWWKTSSRFEHLKMLNEEQTTFLYQMVDLFRSHDINNRGTLDQNEFSNFLQELVEKNLFDQHTHQACQFTEIDRSQDGQIHFNELIAWLRHIGLLN